MCLILGTIVETSYKKMYANQSKEKYTSEADNL